MQRPLVILNFTHQMQGNIHFLEGQSHVADVELALFK